jgi:integrase
MALSDVQIRSAKPRDTSYKLSDEKGLHLLVTPAGGKLWRLKYRLNGVEKKLAIGAYPEVGLGDARTRRDQARAQLAGGSDPAAIKRNAKAAAKLSTATTFKAVASEYIAKTEREGRAAATVAKSKWLLDLMAPGIGERPIAEIEPHELLAVLKRVEARGNLETAKRMRAFASRVFRYAVATVRAKSDPAALLQGAITAPKRKHFGALTTPATVGALLRAIDGYDGQPVTTIALKLSAHVFVRPGELRQAEWTEIDFDAAVWRIGAEKMKGRQEHVVPLSTQALALLRAAQELTGAGSYVFPSLRTTRRPMSENTINAALRRLGFTGDEMTAHGFRAMASTLLNESGQWSPDAIERALAHKDNDQVRAAYHRGVHWKERVAMAQWWSDHLDTLRRGADIVPLRDRALPAS